MKNINVNCRVIGACETMQLSIGFVDLHLRLIEAGHLRFLEAAMVLAGTPPCGGGFTAGCSLFFHTGDG